MPKQPPDKELAVTLEARQWDLVIATLADQPYRIVAKTIESIRAQCLSQEEKPDELAG